MDNEMEIIKFNNEKIHKDLNQKKSDCKMNIVFIFQFINFFLIILIGFYLSKNNFFNYQNNPKTKEASNWTIKEKIKYLRLLTNNDEKSYKGIQECLLNDPDKKFCIYHLILPKMVNGKKRILLGEKKDGCYVLLNDFENIKYAYSFGIYKYIQFDKALADRGIDVYMYDHTINSLPYENPKFHWKKLGLCGKGNENPNMTNLEELIAENGHNSTKNMILKMDIEHWEFESIINLKEETLNQFKYILIEYHFKDEKEFQDDNLYYNVLKKISKSHQAYYARCNGDRGHIAHFGYNRICQIIEVCYIIKEGNTFIKDEDIYPIYEFDYSVPQRGRSEMNLNVLKVFEE